jgi:hypothetical protein
VTLQLFTNNDIPAACSTSTGNKHHGWKAVKALSEHLSEAAEKTDNVGEKERKKKEG